MPHPTSRFTLLASWLLASACGAPFTGVSPSAESEAGAGLEEPQSGGAPESGGHSGLLSKPPVGGTESEGGGGGVSQGDSSGASEGGEPVAEAGAPGGPPPSRCPSLGGEKLALASGFCIDENEVTVAHYRAFLDDAPSLLEQPTYCAGNVTFANSCKFTSPEKEPQRCVDWCDARAYCASVGKRLCGSTEGGAQPFDASGDSAKDQWFVACSHAGELAYPYGGEYDGSACWGGDHPGTSTLTVKSAAGCVGGYEGVWDLSGGLAEWVDSCSADTGPTDACRIRGGSSSGAPEQLRCDAVTATARSTTSSYIGFRCCADLVP